MSYAEINGSYTHTSFCNMSDKLLFIRVLGWTIALFMRHNRKVRVYASEEVYFSRWKLTVGMTTSLPNENSSTKFCVNLQVLNACREKILLLGARHFLFGLSQMRRFSGALKRSTCEASEVKQL
jgi:hypothetical protein